MAESDSAIAKPSRARKRSAQPGVEKPDTRTAILDATQQLMLDEGYAAVSTRQVAKRIGVTSALIHYYFATTDDLLVAVYRRVADRTIEEFKQTFCSDQPLQALWAFNTDTDCTALAMEFMAMANHREAIRVEIASSIEAFRTLQLKALSPLFPGNKELAAGDPLTVIMLATALSRLLVVEKGLNFTMGHDETRDLIARWFAG